MSNAGIVPRPRGKFRFIPVCYHRFETARQDSILHPERIVGNSEVMAEVALGLGKRRYHASGFQGSGNATQYKRVALLD